MTELLEVILRGLGTGAIYALLALGFVIIYKSTGVISFAQPAMMLTGATITSYVAPALGVMLFAGFSFFLSMAVAALITAAVGLVIEQTNEKFARVEGIKKFRMLPKELDHEDGEMTATQKVKRTALYKIFEDLVEGMYGGPAAGVGADGGSYVNHHQMVKAGVGQ